MPLFHGHSYYSLRYGTRSEEELLEAAVRAGLTTLVLTDINTTSACLSFIRLAPRYGIRPVVGIDYRDGDTRRYVALAKNNQGYHEINSLLSAHLSEGTPLPERAPRMHHAYVIYPYSHAPPPTDLTSQEYIGVRLDELRHLAHDAQYAAHPDRHVILHPATFATKRDYNIHRVLRAIDHNALLSQLPASAQASPHDRFYTLSAIRKRYPEHAGLIERSLDLAERCHIYFDYSDTRRSQNLATYTGDQDQDYDLLHQLCWEGVHYRYGDAVTDAIIERIDRELRLIRQMNFMSYFLINWDIINYARKQGYYYVGRGSGANSIVAYLLCITDVDPIDLDLYFERFINLFRKSPPDFDIDFSWRDREDVTRYIFERFPTAALLATYNCFQYRGAVREVGKVFGLPKAEIDQMTASDYRAERLDDLKRLVLRYAGYLQGRPNHLGIHAAGILITDMPITYFSATHLPPKGFRTVQFDMVVAEDVGIYKFDILGQRGLAKIKEALHIIRHNHPEDHLPDIHDMRQLKDDPMIIDLLRSARCLGCFYVESPAMRMLLTKLEVESYLELVAASSIIRPGVAKSGMMREYILRHKHPERVEERAHPILYDIMPDTYGVMVYQEDVIKVAHHFGGLTLAEADVLRRGMSGKFRSREAFDQVRAKFIQNSVRQGHPMEVVTEVWRQIESFAGYAFAKGHSASYAVESYQSLYLKAHYPLEYMTAVMNNGGGFYRIDTYLHEARMLGAQIELPCVNRSHAHQVIDGRTIYLGFGLLKDLETETMRRILDARQRDGVYHDLDDFIQRTAIRLSQLVILIRVGALRFTGHSKPHLLWQAHFLCSSTRHQVDQPTLFHVPATKHTLPQFVSTPIQDAYDEMELLGFALESPFNLLTEPQDENTYIYADEMPQYTNQMVHMIGSYVTAKPTRTQKGDRMYFGTFLDQKGVFIDTVHFPPVAARHPLRGWGIYALKGKVTEDFGHYSLEIMWLKKCTIKPDPRYMLT